MSQSKIFVKLPAAKKQRLSKKSFQIAKAKFASIYDNDDSVPIIFEWNNDKILFLVIGYLRINILMGIYDISTIIFKYIKYCFIDYHINYKNYLNISYMRDNSIICKFKTSNKNRKYCNSWASLIFSRIINNNGQNKCIKLKLLKRIRNCNAGNGIAFSCGLIGIPRSSNTTKLTKLQKVTKCFKNKYTVEDGNCNIFGYNLKINEFKEIESLSYNNVFYNGNICDKATSLSKTNTNINGINKCIYKKLNYNSGVDSIKKNDCISICIENNTDYNNNCNINSYLYFMKNNTTIFQQMAQYNTYKIFKNGKEKLNFDKFDYLFALSCFRCNSAHCSGLEFKVSFM